MRTEEWEDRVLDAPTQQMQEVADEVQTKDELLKALEGDFATGVTRIYINSLGKEVAFKEITVTQQKSLSRIIAGNEQRKDIVYDAQCAIINSAALAEGFDVYKLTEFDRLKILIALYQANMFSNNVKFTCKQCGAENIYTLNYDRVLAKLDEIGLAPKELDYENKNFKFKFTLAYPFVRRISSFYKAYYLKHKVTSKKDARMNDSMTNMEYVNLFISKIDMEVKATGAKRSIDMSKYKASDVEDILAKFPQDVLYTEEGVMNFIAQEYLKKINDSFDKHECAECGTVQEEEGVDQAEGFF